MKVLRFIIPSPELALAALLIKFFFELKYQSNLWRLLNPHLLFGK